MIQHKFRYKEFFYLIAYADGQPKGFPFAFPIAKIIESNLRPYSLIIGVIP